MDLIKDCADHNVTELGMFPTRALTERVCKAYCEPSPCNQMVIRYDLMIEFLDHCLRHLDLQRLDHTFLDITFETKGTLIKEFIFLKIYLELSTNAQSHCQDLLIAVENVVYQMTRHIYVYQMCDDSMVRECGYDWRKDTRSEFRIGVLKALVLQSPTAIMSDELVVEYVKYVQEHLLDLLHSKVITLFVSFKSQLWILHEGISFLMHLLISYPPNHNSQPDILSKTRLHFQDLARNVRYVVCSCMEKPREIETISLKILDLIEKVNVIKGEIIKTICFMVLKETEGEPPKKDQLASLTILLKKMKEFMGKSDCIKTWKDHENLVLFTFYLFQNNIRGDNCTGDDDLFQYTIQLDAAVINHEELNEVLISAQVAAFNMSLRRYGKFCWWDLYLGTKERVDMHMRVGILKAFGWSSTVPLTDELLIAYGECVQESLIELLRYDVVDPLKDQLDILHQGISFVAHLLISYMDEQEKLSHIKTIFQELVRSVGSVICSSFNNRANGDIEMQQNTTELSKLVENMNHIIGETEKLLHQVHINKIRLESPKTYQLGSMNLLLENWKELMECESDMIIPWKEKFRMIYENLVSFKSFIASCRTSDDEELQNLCKSIVDAIHFTLELFLIAAHLYGFLSVRNM